MELGGWYFLIMLAVGLVTYIVVLYVLDWLAYRAFTRTIGDKGERR